MAIIFVLMEWTTLVSLQCTHQEIKLYQLVSG
jgi:hypothetical protein